MKDPNNTFWAGIADRLSRFMGLGAPRSLHEAKQQMDHAQELPLDDNKIESLIASARERKDITSPEYLHPLMETLFPSFPEPEMVKPAPRSRKSNRWRIWATLAILTPLAACALILAGMDLYYSTLAPTPYELKVVGQTQLLAGSAGSIRVVLTNHDTGRPIEGAPVDIELIKTGGLGPEPIVKLASFTTDSQGTGQPHFTLPDDQPGDYELRIVAHPAGSPDEILTHAVKIERSWQLMLSTDKPVYQPGQVILMRSLALRQPDLHPVAGQTSVFQITDPKGNVIFKEQSVTSAYGISSARCPLADEILEGDYTIACQIGDTNSQTTVSVKKYVLPKFKINLDLDRPYYAPGQSIHGSIDAHYFFGKPLRGAEVQVMLTSVENPTLGRTLPSLYTDDDGRTHFTLQLPDSLAGHEQDSGDAQVRIDVAVVDTAGQKQTRTITRLVTTQPLKIEVAPEAGQLALGLSNRIYVLTSYADGQPAQAQLAITGVPRTVLTTRLGAAMFDLTPQADPVTLTIRATDKEGLSSQRQVTLHCGAGAGDFLIRTDKAVYDGGQTMHLTALASGDTPVFVDLIKDGQTILTQTLPVTHGRGDLEFDLPPEAFGTLELKAYRLDEKSGLPVRKSRAIFVRQAQDLNVAAQLDHSQYRPGDKAQLDLHLTDNHGQPVVGAISLSAVDEAVFSVMDSRPGMEGTFFTVEQDLLKPVYAIYPWSPDLSAGNASADVRQFEQAIFSSTAAEQLRADRYAKFQQLVDQNYITPQLLEVLDDPNMAGYLDHMASIGWITPETAALLRGDNDKSSHEMIDSIYRSKIQQIERERRRGLEEVNGGLALLVVASFVLGLALLFIWIPSSAIATLLILTIIGFIIALLLPALGAARKTAPQMKAMSELRGLDQALQMQAQDHPPSAGVPAEPPTSAAPVHLRQWFPETLLWRPELLTDGTGHASLDIDLADSITDWRLSGSAVSGDGRLGALQSTIHVFQPFFVDLNLPVALTRGDEVSVPVVVYSYLDRPQQVRLTLDSAPWYTLLDDAEKQITLQPNQVASVSFRIRAAQAGIQHFQVQAVSAGGVADAVERQIEILPGGQRVEQVQSGNLDQPATMTLAAPADTIEGSARATLKIYPGSFSQVVEGLDAIFQMPYGCFEQTSSTTYPNVLALDYLRRTHKNAPAVEAKALEYIQLGYQRLLGFEVAGGGFDWFGEAPPNQGLSAYGLMEFQDMAKVFSVDPKLIERTRQWLLAQRSADGTWTPKSWRFQDGLSGAVEQGNDTTLSTTAYVAWAVFADGQASAQAPATLDYLDHTSQNTDNPYVLALACNAMEAMDPGGATGRQQLSRLEEMKSSSPDGKQVWWNLPNGQYTTFEGSGQSGNIEATALATLALIRGGQSPATVRAALAWLVAQKDGAGTWYSTQATVLALRALLAGTEAPLGNGQERKIEVSIDGNAVRDVTIPADQADVLKQVDLTSYLAPGTPGNHQIGLRDLNDSGAGYQFVYHYNVPGQAISEAQPQGPLAIDVSYDRPQLPVGNDLNATATVANRMASPAPMVMLDLPIPAGFAPVPEDFDAMVQSGAIAKYQVNPRTVIVYLRDLAPGQPLILHYRLRATMPVDVSVQPARAYEYYNPAAQATSAARRVVVTPSPV